MWLKMLGILIAAVAAVAVATGCGGSDSSADPAPVSAYPLPGTQVASAETQLSFRGLPADELGTIEVSGSRSGPHDGTLEPHSDGQGASFVPAEPFEEGERVTVTTDLDVRGADEGSYEMTIARQAPLGDPFPPMPVPEDREARRFRSRPDLRPPRVTITEPARDAAAGSIFVGIKNGPGAQDGPLIMDDEDEPLWFKPLEDVQAADVRVQEYRGEPVLTWWEGTVIQPGAGDGEFVIADRSYREIKRFPAGNGYTGDLHELIITPRDTALILAYNPVRWDLSTQDGTRRGAIEDQVIQEIDLETGLVLFEWHSLDEIGLRESYQPPPDDPGGSWDYLHLNSIAERENGDLIVSGRNTWAVYEIARATGDVRWRLGGKRSDFEMDPGTQPAWQHDARERPDGSITMFDNGASPEEHPESRGIVVGLDMERMTATLEREYTHPEELSAPNQANMQTLPDGRVFIGWGPEPVFSQYSADGELLFNGRFQEGDDTYRAYRFEWSGQPDDDPAVAAACGVEETIVYASWNGATEVESWRVLAGETEDALEPVATAARDGFETAIRLEAPATNVAVQALDADGDVLGASDVVAP